MKNWGLGLFIGLTAGAFASFIKNKNGQRIGQPIKEAVHESKDNAAELATAIKKAQLASRELKQQLPNAQKAIIDIENDFDNYQISTQKNLAALQTDARKINDQLANIKQKPEENVKKS